MMSRIESGRIIVIGKNNQMPTLSRSTARVVHAARPSILPDRGRAATSSRMTRESGAAADLRSPKTQTRPAVPRALLTPAGRAFLHEALEVFTVALGLTVFGLVAGFFLVLA